MEAGATTWKWLSRHRPGYQPRAGEARRGTRDVELIRDQDTSAICGVISFAAE